MHCTVYACTIYIQMCIVHCIVQWTLKRAMYIKLLMKTFKCALKTCTVYTFKCALYNVHCTVYCLLNTINVQRIVYYLLLTLECTLYSVLVTVKNKMCFIQLTFKFSFYREIFTVNILMCVVNFTLYWKHSYLHCTLYSVLCSIYIHNVLRTLKYANYSVIILSTIRLNTVMYTIAIQMCAVQLNTNRVLLIVWIQVCIEQYTVNIAMCILKCALYCRHSNVLCTEYCAL